MNPEDSPDLRETPLAQGTGLNGDIVPVPKVPTPTVQPPMQANEDLPTTTELTNPEIVEEEMGSVLQTHSLNAGAGVIEDLNIGAGLHQILTGRESHATTLALTLAGRMKPKAGEVIIAGENTPRGIAKHVALAGATELDGLDRLVKLGQVIREQYAWGNPWWRRVPKAEDIMATPTWTHWAEPLGLMLDPKNRIGDLDVVDRLLVRVVLAGIARPDASLLLVDDIDQIRDIGARHEALLCLQRLSEVIPTVVMSVNHFDDDPFNACHHVHLVEGGQN